MGLSTIVYVYCSHLAVQVRTRLYQQITFSTTTMLDKTLFVKLYLNRLVNTLVPSEFGAEYTRSLVNDLLAYLVEPENTNPDRPVPSQIVEGFKTLFLSSGRQSEWVRFLSILELLAKERSLDQIANYLMFLSKLLPETATENTQQTSWPQKANTYTPAAPSSLQLSPYKVQNRMLSQTAPMADLIKPYYESLDEATILSHLAYTLLGQDTNLLSFNGDSVEIPPTINTSYAQLLRDILEPALLFRKLLVLVEDHKGKITSPIKTAYLRGVESKLTQYVSSINRIFHKTPSSLIDVFNNLQDEIRTLRLISYLYHLLTTNDGYEFLTHAYHLSNFGDPFVKQLAGEIFHEIAIPYYEYMEYWLIRGELVDENNEFFVAFNPSENHISDIIEYKENKLPAFMDFELDICVKIFQIGKTLVFLEKYCKELDWVNDYVSRYSQFIYKANKGFKSMKLNVIQDMVLKQYNEIMNYLTVVLQGKHDLFQHLLNFKSIMLMGASDFIETINERGAQILSEPASVLTSSRLSELLMDSINASSVRQMPDVYRNRIDARILDLSHGNMGWDVFTLEYKIFDQPLGSILDYHDESKQYMRMFNFLWSLRHYQSILNKSCLDFMSLHKNDLRAVRMRYQKLKGNLSKSRDHKVAYFFTAVRTINLIRYRLLTFLTVLLNYLSFNVIQESFDESITRTLFKTHAIMGPEFTNANSRKDRKLPLLNSKFAEKCGGSRGLLGLQLTQSAKHNMNNYTIDNLTDIHRNFLSKVSQCRLLSEDTVGRFTGETFISQIFELCELIFAFVKSSEEFGASVVNYIYLLNLEHDSNSIEFDDDLEDLHQRLSSLKRVIYQDIYAGKFQPRMTAFTKDLRADLHLKELSKML